jgi:hypothetical protein
MRDEDIAEAQRVSRECGIAAGATFEVSAPVELYFSRCSPSGIDIEKIALLVEG